MNLSFFKYQGAGNDFVLIDNRQEKIQLSTTQIAHLCNRKFGVGADGLMLLELDDTSDFKMVYFNSDGNESTMCGNGGRCIAAFAHHLGLVGNTMEFVAIDGLHKATINTDSTVSLHMTDVTNIKHADNYIFLDTGSPHVVKWVENLEHFDVYNQGKALRNSDVFKPGGSNVNFISKNEHGINIRTYERGVEDETLACGTGVTAAAIVSVGKQTGNFTVNVTAIGGELQVTFHKKDEQNIENIVLTGDAKMVFKGQIHLAL